ncbi:oxidoreductase [Penicillium longicatenatum]|uniref:oxidoreductase n=1 Tax=Penicillium longicatenatum TaxID=1561947 RepID=UPI002549501C|nr:oxidoreductase [Penicillium longicatenatum]KAJ5648845.1 oxidoreductase [Penicillium longicatenatum]
MGHLPLYLSRRLFLKTDITLPCLSDDAAIVEIIRASLSAGDIKESSLLNTSTVHPDTTTYIAAKIQVSSGRFVASRVFSAPTMAEAGQAICFLAGPKKAIDE